MVAKFLSVSTSVKVARIATGRNAIIAFGGAFHGRTMMGMSLTGKVDPYKKGFGAMMPDVYHIPFPQEVHGITTEEALAGMTKLFKADLDPTRVAAIIFEPVQGEGGFYPAPKDLVVAIRKLCDDNGIVMIADEVQTGFARTGRLFAIEHAGIHPDLMTVAKSLAGGFPLSAVTGRADIMDSPLTGGLGGTYAGSPLGCAAGLAVLDVIDDENLCARASQLGETLMARLRDLQSRWDCIGEIRGLGAIVAMELVKQRNPDAPDAELTRALVQAAGRRGLVLLSCGVYANVVRFLMPLTISDGVFAEGLAILEAALEDVSRR